MNEDIQIPCRLVPNACWRRVVANKFIWYMGGREPGQEYNPAFRDKNGTYYIAFDPAHIQNTGGTLEEQMRLGETK